MQNTTIQPNDMPGRQKTGAPQAHLSSKAHVHALHASACRHSHCCRLAPPPRVCQARGGGMRTAGAAMYTAVAYHPIISYGTVQTDMHSSRRGCRYTGGQAAAKSPAVGCLPCLAITRLIRTCRATACAKPVCTHTHARASAHTACPSNLNAHPPSAARDTQQPHTQRCKRLCVCVHRTSTKECAQALAPHASPRAPPHPPTTALELWLCVGNGGAQHHSVAGDAQQDCQLAPRSTLNPLTARDAALVRSLAHPAPLTGLAGPNAGHAQQHMPFVCSAHNWAEQRCYDSTTAAQRECAGCCLPAR
jgi:hypothetical protein